MELTNTTNRVKVTFHSQVEHGVPPNKKVTVAKVTFQHRFWYVDPYALALGPYGSFVDTSRGTLRKRAREAVADVLARTKKQNKPVDTTCPNCNGTGIDGYITHFVQDGEVGGEPIGHPEEEPEMCSWCGGTGEYTEKAEAVAEPA